MANADKAFGLRPLGNLLALVARSSTVTKLRTTKRELSSKVT